MEIKTNNYFKDRIDPETGIQYEPTILVLHITDGSFLATKSWFENPHSYASSNWVVSEDGVWHKCVDEKHAPWTNGRVIRPTRELIPGVNPNLYSLTVEVVNQGQFPPWVQWVSWARGCKKIMDMYGIGFENVVNHYEIQGNKTCPMPWFTRFYLQLLLRFV